MLTLFIIKNKNTPLHDAASQGHTEVVQLLIRSGATLNALNKVTVYIHQWMSSLLAF